MRNLIQKVNNSFDLAVKFFLLFGSIYFIYYALQVSKPIYILLSILIYFVSYILRKHLFKFGDSKGFTEPGIFFITFLFLAYLLFLTGIDKEIESYLPNKLILQSGVSFLFIFLITLLSGLKTGMNKFIFISLLVGILVIFHFNENYINTLILNNPNLIEYIVGFPVIYLGFIIFGLDNFFSRL